MVVTMRKSYNHSSKMRLMTIEMITVKAPGQGLKNWNCCQFYRELSNNCKTRLSTQYLFHDLLKMDGRHWNDHVPTCGLNQEKQYLIDAFGVHHTYKLNHPKMRNSTANLFFPTNLKQRNPPTTEKI